jgi:hypothetical protein
MASSNEFHHTDNPANKTVTIVALIIIALLIGGAALYGFSSGLFRQGPQLTHSQSSGM